MSNSIRDRFGKGSSAGSGGLRYKNFKLQDGEQVYRVIPPMKSLRENARGWAVYHKVHYGYEGLDFRDRNQKKARPFGCIDKKDKKTEMITVSCPECRLIERKTKALEDKMEIETQRLKSLGVLDGRELEKRVRDFVKDDLEWFKKHNVDKKWHLNVMNQAGEIGVLRIPHKSKQALDEKIASLEKMGINPFEPDRGVFFVFKRSGRAFDTHHSVDILMEPGPTPGSMQFKFAPITDEQLEKIDADLPDLSEIVRVITKEQIQALVDDSGGDPELVDRIMKLNSNVTGGSNGPRNLALMQDEEPEPEEPGIQYNRPPPGQAAIPQTTPVATPAFTPPSAPAVPSVATFAASSEEDEEAKLMRQLEEARARKQNQARVAAVVTAPVPAIVTAPVPAVAGPAVANLDPLDPNIPADQFAQLFPPPRR